MYTISAIQKNIKGSIQLTASKSISNRLLIIHALCNKAFEIQNLASAQDTQTLQAILNYYPKQSTIDVGPAGTVIRFMTAFLACGRGEWIITGSERMKKRPIGPLVDALRKLGGEISFQETEGFPPLKIIGQTLIGGEIEVDGSVSSQFITALLLIGPSLKNGISLKLIGKVTSRPYIEMTIKLMEQFGAKVNWEKDLVVVYPMPYFLDNSPEKIIVEADWSGASYLYALAALSENAELEIKGLFENSLQGDSALVDIFNHFGIKTTYTETGVLITKAGKAEPSFEYDFSSCPDIAQTVAVVMAGLNVEGKLTGLETLKVKETNRVEALVVELGKLGYEALESAPNELTIKSGRKDVKLNPVATYDDHRMAMAFAPLALVLEQIQIKEPEVVKKSYPEYWEDLKKLGLLIK